MKLSMMSYTLARAVAAPEDFDIVAMCRLSQELELDAVDMVTLYGRDAHEVRKLLDDFGLKVACHTFQADVSYPEPAARQPGIDEIKRGIDNALVLGTDKTMLPTPGKEGVAREQTRANIIAALVECVQYASTVGVTLTVENFPGYLSPFVVSSDVLQAMREAPGLGLTFDNGNVVTGGEDPGDSFRACAAHVVHAHFKDWRVVGEGEGLRGVDGRYYVGALIGEGIVDHRATLRAMAEAGYSGYINIEYEGNDYRPDDAVRKAVPYLRALMAELGLSA